MNCGHSMPSQLTGTQGINDLATSPANPYIIASASDDTTVRIWSLAKAHDKQPCLALLGGEGHVWDLLSVVRPKRLDSMALLTSRRHGMTLVAMFFLRATIKSSTWYTLSPRRHEPECLQSRSGRSQSSLLSTRKFPSFFITPTSRLLRFIVDS